MSNRQLRIGFQMDPPETIDISGDSTFALMLEAQKRGYDLWVYDVKSLALNLNGDAKKTQVFATMRQCRVKDMRGNHIEFLQSKRCDLCDMDVILMRQDPPFDMGYITATHILDHVNQQGDNKTIVVNNPRWVRECPEKILVTNFPSLMPPTLISWDKNAIKEFHQIHQDIILKPLYGNGGYGVFHLKPQDENLNALLEMFFAQSKEPVMVQRYLPEITEGDKRIILVDGEPVGAISRIPMEGEHRSNMHVGGVAHFAEITARDKEICQKIGPFLKEHGLIFVGIDVIGSFLTEINVTSPTGIREIKRLGTIDVGAKIWDAIEKRLA